MVVVIVVLVVTDAANVAEKRAGQFRDNSDGLSAAPFNEIHVAAGSLVVDKLVWRFAPSSGQASSQPLRNVDSGPVQEASQSSHVRASEPRKRDNVRAEFRHVTNAQSQTLKICIFYKVAVHIT
jgi:hypothetical protein